MSPPRLALHQTSVHLRPDQIETLKRIHERTKIPVARLIRDGVDAVLVAHAPELQRLVAEGPR